MIIGIIGRSIDPSGNICSAGSGKNEVAKILVARGFTSIALADKMKHFLLELGVDRENLWGPSYKRHEPLKCLGGKSARWALQTLGTEWGRNVILEDIWAQQAMKLAKEHGGDVVIPDVRFNNEIEIIRKHHGQTVLVERPVDTLPEMENIDHDSEQELRNIQDVDAVIRNDGSLLQLERRVILVLDDLRENNSAYATRLQSIETTVE